MSGKEGGGSKKPFMNAPWIKVDHTPNPTRTAAQRAALDLIYMQAAYNDYLAEYETTKTNIMFNNEDTFRSQLHHVGGTEIQLYTFPEPLSYDDFAEQRRKLQS